MHAPSDPEKASAPKDADQEATRYSVPAPTPPTKYPSLPVDTPGGANQDPDQIPLPQPFGRYHVIRRLGRGGMGTVYLAHDTVLDRPVALKVPRFSPEDGPQVLERFLREARAAATIEHPNICPVYDVGAVGGVHFLAMAYIEGRPLSDLVRQAAPLPAREAAGLVQKLALALEEAHQKGVIHRDLKPSNVMLNRRGEPVVMDFGLARRGGTGDVRLTQTGQVMGTPAYMPPEQVSGDLAAVGPVSDVYSLGVILYELLTGRVPFRGSVAEVLAQVLRDEPARPSAHRLDIDCTLEAICLRALAKAPARRFASMAEMARALSDYLRAAEVPTQEVSSPQQSPCQPGSHGGGVSRPMSADVGPSVPQDPNCELAEVRHEQAFHLRTFAGRQRLLEEVRTWIDAGTEGAYLLLLGPPGQGKSAFMAELARGEKERRGCLLHMVKSHRNPLKFVPSLLTQAARLAGVRFGADAYRGDLDDLRNSLVKALEAVRDRTGRAVLLLDALDELESSTERLAFLPRSLPDGVRVVLTCRPDVPLVQVLRARLHPLQERWLPALAEEDLPAVLERRLGPEAVRELQELVDWGALFRRLQGTPLLLRRALDHIAGRLGNGPAGAPPRLDLEMLPATLGELFADVYREIADKRGAAPARPEGRQKARLLQLLCLAREPLGFEQMSGLLAADGQPLALEDCRDRVDEMSQFLLDVGGGRFKPWHHGLADHVRQEVLGEAGVRQVEGTFCRWLQAGRPTLYGLRHRVNHLLAAGQPDEAARLLMDLPFLEAKAEAGLVFELAADFSAVVAALPGDDPRRRLLRLVEEAVRTDLHFLDRHPGTLFQCLWNRCWWYDCPQAAQHYDPPEGGWSAEGPPWERAGPKLFQLLEAWRAGKEQRSPGFVWVRSLRPPPMHLGTALRAIFQGHEGAVRCVAFAPDGGRIASGSTDRAVRVWDAATGAELTCLRGHEDVVVTVAFAPNAGQIASGSDDGTIRIWDTASGAELACLRGHQGTARSIAFAPKGGRIASGSEDGTVRVWDAAGGRELACLSGHAGPVNSVTFAPDGTRIASGSDDRTVRVWDAADGRELACLSGHAGPVNSVAFAPDGTRIASGSWDETVRVWDAVGGAERTSLHGHEEEVNSVSFAPDSLHVASGSNDCTVRVWDAGSGQQLACLFGHVLGVWSVCFAPDGRQVASGSHDRTVRIWNASGGPSPARLHGHNLLVRNVCFASDGRHLASGSRDRTVRVWDVASGVELFCLQGHEDVVHSVCFAPEGRRLASGSRDGTVRVWDVVEGKQLACLRGHHSDVYCVTFSADGQRIASGSYDRRVQVWDAASGQRLTCLRGHTNAILSLAFSPDGTHIASGSQDETVRVWEVASGQLLACLNCPGRRAQGVAFSPDGRLLASGSADGTVRVWDVKSSQQLACVSDRGRTVREVTFSPDSNYVLAEMDDGTRKAWDVSSRHTLGESQGKEDRSAVAVLMGLSPLRHVIRGLETVIETAAGQVLAWFPDRVARGLTAHPSGRIWAAVSWNHVYLITLEGEAQNLIRGS